MRESLGSIKALAASSFFCNGVTHMLPLKSKPKKKLSMQSTMIAFAGIARPRSFFSDCGGLSPTVAFNTERVKTAIRILVEASH